MKMFTSGLVVFEKPIFRVHTGLKKLNTNNTVKTAQKRFRKLRAAFKFYCRNASLSLGNLLLSVFSEDKRKVFRILGM